MTDKTTQTLSFLRPFIKPLILALILTCSLTVIGMVPPLLMRNLINDIAGNGNWGIFPLIVFLLFLVPVLREGINIANGITLNNVGRGIIGKTRKQIFSHLMQLSLMYYDETPVGAVKERLFGDVGTISSVATGGLIALAADLVSVIFAVVVMLKLSVPLSLLTFALLPLYFINYRFFSKRIQRTTTVLRSRMDHISSMLQERLSAHELIQSYGQEKAEAIHFTSQAKQIMDASVRGSAYSLSL